MQRPTTLAVAAVLSALIPLSAQAYELPLRGSDLANGERYTTFTHKAGIQAEGNDIGAQANVGGGEWSGLKTPGADRKVLTNWRIYGKPVYAMAPGVVISCWRNAPQNTPGSYHPDYVAGKVSGGGNHFWIKQDDGATALYAHMQTGSVPAELCPHNGALMSDKDDDAVKNGVRIKAGQMLGRVGNSGASESGPHLHVHMQKAGQPVVMTFDRGLTAPFQDGKTPLSTPWTPLAGKALPKGVILVWPARPVGNYSFNGVKAADYQGLADHLADSGEMPNLITCEGNGASYTSSWVPAKGQWRTHHGMTAAEAAAKHAAYTQQGFQRTSNYTCGAVSVAVWKK